MSASRVGWGSQGGSAGEVQSALGIPSIYDRVCQQALLNRLEPIFEPVFDEANFGYRHARSAKDALGEIWKEIRGAPAPTRQPNASRNREDTVKGRTQSR